MLKIFRRGVMFLEPGYTLLSAYNGSLKDAVDAAGSTVMGIMINQEIDDLNESLVIPSNLTLIWQKGYVLGGSYTLTINGTIDAGQYQLFDSALTVAFGEGAKEVRPEWWGADPTNTSDCSAALHRCITQAAGIQVRLSGTYKVDTLGSTNITQPINFKGDRGATLDGNNTTTSGMVFAGTVSSVRVDGVKFYNCGRWPLYAANGVTISEFIFTNNIINDCPNGVYLNCTVANALVTHNHITELSDSATACYAIALGANLNSVQGNSTRFVVTNNIIEDVDCALAGSGSIGILVRGSDVLIANNHVENVRNTSDDAEGCGIYEKAIFGRIQNNTIKDCGGTGNGALTIKGLDRAEAGSDARGYGIIISGNHLSHTTGAYRGIFIDDADVLCQGNYLEGFGNAAIAINDYGYDNITIDGNIIVNHRSDSAINIATTGGKGFRITNNTIDGLLASQGSIGSVYAIRVNQQGNIEDVVISGNHIYADLNCSATSGIYGIFIRGTAGTIDRLTIENNDINISHDTLTTLQGILLYPYSTLTDVLIQGNHIKCPEANANEKPIAIDMTNIAGGELTVRNNRAWSDPSALKDPIDKGQIGITITDVGATGAFTPTLPTAKGGMEYSFLKTTAQTFQVEPASGETIRGGAANEHLQLGAVGDTVTLRCIVDGTWEIVAGQGTYTYV